MRYYINTRAQANGDHEVHTAACTFLPSEANSRYLGEFASCHEAVAEAKRHYPSADGCFYCSPDCHRR